MRTFSYNISHWKRYFIPLWGGQAASLFGSVLVDFALIWYLTITTGSAIVLTTASLVSMLPAILISPILGSMVDRWKRRHMIILADGMTAVFTVLLALLFWFGVEQIWHIYVLLFVRSVTSITHFMSMHAATSLMVPHAQLTRVAGLNRTLQGVMNIAGPPVGALFMTILPIQSILLIDVGTALVAILPLLFIIIPEPQKKTGQADIGKVTLFQDLLVGFRYVRAWKGLVALIMVAVVANFLVHPVFSLVPLLVTDHFGGGALELGWLEAMLGAGTILGGLALSTWGGFKRKIYTVGLGTFITGLGVLIVAFSPQDAYWIALGGFFLVGMSITLVDGPIFAILQSNVAPEIQGRVMAFMLSAGKVAGPLGLLIAGFLTEWFGVRFWFFFAGVGWILVNLIGFSLPVLRNIEEERSVIGEAPAAE